MNTAMRANAAAVMTMRITTIITIMIRKTMTITTAMKIMIMSTITARDVPAAATSMRDTITTTIMKAIITQTRYLQAGA